MRSLVPTYVGAKGALAMHSQVAIALFWSAIADLPALPTTGLKIKHPHIVNNAGFVSPAASGISVLLHCMAVWCHWHRSKVLLSQQELQGFQ